MKVQWQNKKSLETLVHKGFKLSDDYSHSAVGGALAVGLGAINQAPISGFYGWFTVENWPVYILAIAVGTLIVAGMSVALRKASAGEEMVGSSYDDEIDEAEWEA